MIYDDNQTWWENNDTHEISRLFEYTDEEVREKYQNNLDKLKNIPCLFTYESQGRSNIKGHIGYIKSIRQKKTFKKELNLVIDYLLAREYPSIKIDTGNYSDLLDLGIEGPKSWELNRDHWAVKNKNLFKFVSKSLAKEFPTQSILKPQEMRNIWGENYENKKRIFFSHKATYREKISDIKTRLEKENFSCFVAHQDIHPTLIWQKEIIKALDTMDIFIGIITDDFHTGSWTDQEIGYAYKRNVPRIFIKTGKTDPQGFISSEQALKAIWDNIHIKIMEHLKKD